MGWNYRVLRYSNGELGIHEVYYDEAGNPTSCTEDAVGPGGDDLAEIRAVMEDMKSALAQPILDYADIVTGGKK